MLFRLTVVIFIIFAFAGGFAEIVDRSVDPPGHQRTADPCQDWSNPHCQRTP
jgi:hypothetical protein